MSENKTLLQQIEEEAVDSKSDVASLLRKCQVLATRLRNDALKDWIRYELNGSTAGIIQIVTLASVNAVSCIRSDYKVDF